MGVCDDDAGDRVKGKYKTRMVDPKQLGERRNRRRNKLFNKLYNKK